MLACSRLSRLAFAVAALAALGLSCNPVEAQLAPVDVFRRRHSRLRSAPSISAATPNYQLVILGTFDGTNGANPFGGLVADGQGNLFGTTSKGGDSGLGVVFQYTALGGLQAVASFNGFNGYDSVAPLVTDGSGNIYGAANWGGSGYVSGQLFSGAGTLFKFSAAGGIQSLFTDFDPGTSGYEPSAPYVDGSGNLYGVTFGGGANGQGALYEWSPSGGLQTLAAFGGAYGANPVGPLVADGAGSLYGVTNNGNGTVFVYSATDGLNTIATFNGANGSGPEAGLVSDGEGAFYGTTGNGGANGCGTIFEYSLAGGIQTLYSFSGLDGFEPASALLLDSNGDLYGTTAFGGPNYTGGGQLGYGTVFKYSASTGLQTLHFFDGSDGAEPTGNLLLDGSGNLFGTTNGGGASFSGGAEPPFAGDGVLFELQPPRAISGVVTLQGCVNSVQPITFELRPAAGATFSQTVTLDSDGGYTVPNVPNGTYTIAIKGSEWLRTDVLNVVVNGGDVSGVNATLLPGDANGDNVVDLNDFSILAAAFGAKAGDPDYNPSADFNCDGVVDLTDFSLLAADFGLTGDP